MAGNEDVVETPIELLRQLIEESGKWVEESVTFTRQLLIMLITIIYLAALGFWVVFYDPVVRFLSGEGDLPLAGIVTLIIWFACFIMIVRVAFKARHTYKNRVARRDRWKRNFEVLKKKEEEIERLLSEGAD